MSKSKHLTPWYGWLPDLPDSRDWSYAKLTAQRRAVMILPPSVDLRSLCSPVEDQGALGSCTANALAGAAEFLEQKDANPTFIDASRLFIYYQERLIEGTVRWDAGAFLRDGIKAMADAGVPNEQLWPYDVRKFRQKPTKAAYSDASKRRVTAYARIETLNDMKLCLASGFPFVFGFTVYESFESDVVTKTGVVPMPAPTEAVLGGHAVLCVGYDDASQRVIARNSWGADWGMAGYFTMPYAYVEDRNLSDDFWTIRAEASF